VDDIRDHEDLGREFDGNMVGKIKAECQTMLIPEEDKIGLIQATLVDETLHKLTIELLSGDKKEFGHVDGKFDES